MEEIANYPQSKSYSLACRGFPTANFCGDNNSQEQRINKYAETNFITAPTFPSNYSNYKQNHHRSSSRQETADPVAESTAIDDFEFQPEPNTSWSPPKYETLEYVSQFRDYNSNTGSIVPKLIPNSKHSDITFVQTSTTPPRTEEEIHEAKEYSSYQFDVMRRSVIHRLHKLGLTKDKPNIYTTSTESSNNSSDYEGEDDLKMVYINNDFLGSRFSTISGNNDGKLSSTSSIDYIGLLQQNGSGDFIHDYPKVKCKDDDSLVESDTTTTTYETSEKHFNRNIDLHHNEPKPSPSTLSKFSLDRIKHGNENLKNPLKSLGKARRQLERCLSFGSKTRIAAQPEYQSSEVFKCDNFPSEFGNNDRSSISSVQKCPKSNFSSPLSLAGLNSSFTRFRTSWRKYIQHRRTSSKTSPEN